MRTNKELLVERSEIYRSELIDCPKCGEKLKAMNQVNGRKTVQSMGEVLRIGYRPYRCENCECEGGRWGSSAWQQVAPFRCTYGYDVIGQVGWERQTYHRTFGEIHSDLRRHTQISENQVMHLYYERYLPLLACHERIRWPELYELSAKNGLILGLDGLAPEGGEAQLWVIRELQSNLTLRSGYLSCQDQPTFENFLSPIVKHGLKVSYVLSDKQRGLVPAVASVFGPETKHSFCQSHYLKNLSEPLAEADEAMKVTLRKTVRIGVGELIRQEGVESPGVLIVTGLLPTPIAEAQTEILSSTEQATPETSDKTAAPAQQVSQHDDREAVVEAMMRRVRYLLTLKGRPPFRLAGLEMVTQLTLVVTCLDQMLAHLPESRLLQLRQGLQLALDQVHEQFQTLSIAALWVRQIADLLDPDLHPNRSSAEVKLSLFALLDTITQQAQDEPALASFAAHLRKVSHSYAPGLFFSYVEPALPRTNNDRESEFRSLNQRLLRTSGQIALARRTIQRSGAWELIPRPDSLLATVSALSRVPTADFELERQRFRLHRQRFRLHSRSPVLVQRQLQQLLHSWSQIPPHPITCV